VKARQQKKEGSIVESRAAIRIERQESTLGGQKEKCDRKKKRVMLAVLKSGENTNFGDFSQTQQKHPPGERRGKKKKEIAEEGAPHPQ